MGPSRFTGFLDPWSAGRGPAGSMHQLRVYSEHLRFGFPHPDVGYTHGLADTTEELAGRDRPAGTMLWWIKPGAVECRCLHRPITFSALLIHHHQDGDRA